MFSTRLPSSLNFLNSLLPAPCLELRLAVVPTFPNLSPPCPAFKDFLDSLNSPNSLILARHILDLTDSLVPEIPSP